MREKGLPETWKWVALLLASGLWHCNTSKVVHRLRSVETEIGSAPSLTQPLPPKDGPRLSLHASWTPSREVETSLRDIPSNSRPLSQSGFLVANPGDYRLEWQSLRMGATYARSISPRFGFLFTGNASFSNAAAQTGLGGIQIHFPFPIVQLTLTPAFGVLFHRTHIEDSVYTDSNWILDKTLGFGDEEFQGENISKSEIEFSLARAIGITLSADPQWYRLPFAPDVHFQYLRYGLNADFISSNHMAIANLGYGIGIQSLNREGWNLRLQMDQNKWFLPERTLSDGLFSLQLQWTFPGEE